MLSRTLVFKINGMIAILLCAVTCVASNSLADEYTVTEESEPFSSGHFTVSASSEPFNMMLPINAKMDTAKSADDSNESLTIGDLWTFYNQLGIKSKEKLTLCMDVDSLGGSGKDVQLSTIDLRIVDSLDSTRTIKKYTLNRERNDSIFLPGYRTSSYRPEAQFQFDLDFDLMKEYDGDSEHKIILNVQMADGTTQTIEPKFYFTGQRSSFNFVLVVLFAVFWAGVFLVLFRVTNPSNRQQVTKKPMVTA